MEITDQEIEVRFTYHAPADQAQVGKFRTIREDAKLFAYQLRRFCPDSRELALALEKLEECVMWANASIARREGYQK